MIELLLAVIVVAVCVVKLSGGSKSSARDREIDANNRDIEAILAIQPKLMNGTANDDDRRRAHDILVRNGRPSPWVARP